MSSNNKTYILKGFDDNQTKSLSLMLEYVSSMKFISNKVSIIDKLNVKLLNDDFLIIIIDELSLEQIIQNNTNKDFFIDKDFKHNQIILILDDINISSLPEYLQHFQTFSTTIDITTNTAEDSEEWDKPEESKIKLIEIIDDLVYYINKVNTGIQKEKLTIYLGPTDDNTGVEYQKITRELLHRDYNILPEISNPTAIELINNKEYLLEMIKSADLSIHFIGHKSILQYPENISSAIKINNITAEYCKSTEGKQLQRIVYVPSEKLVLNELLDQKILQFKSDTKLLLNAELIQTPIEKFKEIILLKLNDISNPNKEKSFIENSNKSVYFIYPPGKEEDITSYITWFEKNNITYSKSQVELDQLELLNYHQNQLTTCDSVIVYNSGNNEWLNRKLSDIKKSPGWGRKKPFKIKAICGTKSSDDLIENDSNNSFIIVNNCDEFNNTQFKNLLTD